MVASYCPKMTRDGICLVTLSHCDQLSGTSTKPIVGWHMAAFDRPKMTRGDIWLILVSHYDQLSGISLQPISKYHMGARDWPKMTRGKILLVTVIHCKYPSRKIPTSNRWVKYRGLWLVAIFSCKHPSKPSIARFPFHLWLLIIDPSDCTYHCSCASKIFGTGISKTRLASMLPKMIWTSEWCCWHMPRNRFAPVHWKMIIGPIDLYCRWIWIIYFSIFPAM